MSTVAATELSVNHLIDVVRQMPDKERREFRRQFKKLEDRANGGKSKATGSRSDTEDDLLTRIRINSRLPDAAHRRFNRLRRKLQDETISESELTELQGLTSRLEGMAVERLHALIELARLRGTDVKSLMKEMGLNKRRYV